MSPKTQYNFMRYSERWKGCQGFTLVELLVVIVIIGILTAISLPSIINQTAKAKQVEAKQNMNAINKAQQTWRSENLSFTNNLDDLALGRLQGGNAASIAYNYTLLVDADDSKFTALSTANDPALKSYASKVAITTTNSTINNSLHKQWSTVICEANTPGTTAVTEPTDGSTCAAGSSATK
jgi:type IV pilus assembly protein PilA